MTIVFASVDVSSEGHSVGSSKIPKCFYFAPMYQV